MGDGSIIPKWLVWVSKGKELVLDGSNRQKAMAGVVTRVVIPDGTQTRREKVPEVVFGEMEATQAGLIVVTLGTINTNLIPKLAHQKAILNLHKVGKHGVIDE